MRTNSLRVFVLLVVVALFLSLLTLGTVDRSEAQAADLTCEVGVLDGDRCVETGDAPAPAGADLCPVSDAVFEDAAGCFELVPQVGGTTCPADTTPAADGESCRRPVDPIVQPGDCPDGFAADLRFLGDRCARVDMAIQSDPACLDPARGTANACYVLRPPALLCSVGVLAGDVCVIEGPPPFNVPGATICNQGFALIGGSCVRYGEPVTDVADPCPGIVEASGACRVPVPARQPELQCAETGEVLEGSDCILRVDLTTLCPVGFEIDGDGVCSQAIDASQRDEDCPEGARGAVNGCYIFVAMGPSGASVCVQGQLVGSSCVINGPAPVENDDGVLECEPAYGLVADGCVRLEDAIQAAAQCPQGSVESSEGYCRKPVANARGAYFCESPLASLLARECIFSTQPIPSNGGNCPVNFVAEPQACVRWTPATLSDIGCRPNSLGSAGNCFVYVARAGSTTCVEGQLTSDGTQCYVFPRLIPQDDTVDCPAGYTADDSLGGICARFEPATAGGAICPDGAQGVPGACYILVAKGPRGALTCDQGDLVGNQCVIVGAPPMTTPGECRITAEVMLDGDFCYRLVQEPDARFVCTADGSGDHNTGPYLLVDDKCIQAISDDVADAFPGGNVICGAVIDDGFDVQGDYERDADATNTIAGYCTLNGTDLDVCITPDIVDGNGCRREVPLSGGVGQCAPTFGLVDGECIRYEQPSTPAAQCPEGSLEDAAGDCRKPVEDAQGAYFCEDPTAALNGKSCVFTAGFITVPGQNLYVCDRGERSLIGSSVVCIVGDAIAGAEPCPAGAQLQTNGRCTRLVGDAGGGFYCEDADATRNGDECLLFPASARCPSIAYSPDFSLGQACARFEPASQAADLSYFCRALDARLNGRACVFTTGYVYDDVELVSTCPDEADVFAEGDECFQRVSFESAVCPDDAAPVDGITGCRKTVPLAQPANVCAADFELVDEQCLRFSEPIDRSDLDCAGVDAGAAGCDGVIATSQESLANESLLTQQATTVTFAACADGTASFRVSENGTEIVGGSMTEAPAGLYTATYVVSTGGTFEIDVTVECPDGDSTTESAELVFIDPSGVITDCVGAPVQGATVTLLRSETDGGPLVTVTNGDATIMDPAINTNNPSITDAQGAYRWDVTAGFYQVSAAVEGQATVLSAVIAVPPARTDVDLVFESLNCAAPTPAPTPTAIPTPSPTATPIATSVPTTTTSAGSPQPIGPTGALVAPERAAVAVTQTASNQHTNSTRRDRSEAPLLTWFAIAMLGVGGTFVIGARRRRRTRYRKPASIRRLSTSVSRAPSWWCWSSRAGERKRPG